MRDDTIAAVATAVAPGQGSVAIVRLSGPDAESIGRRLFVAPGQQAWESHRVLYGHVVDPASGERLDEALLLLMKAPRSFTREDVVEFHCHGGLVCVQRVLDQVLAAEEEVAEPPGSTLPVAPAAAGSAANRCYAESWLNRELDPMAGRPRLLMLQ